MKLPLAQWPVVALLVGLAGTGCARPSSPSGGPIPESPPRLVETRPGPLEVVAPFEGPVRIRFDRTLSEQIASGSASDAVEVSPRNGNVEVEVDGAEIQISMEGGFLAPTPYRITVRPRFQDRYGNSLVEPIDLVFSTSGALEPNLLVGVVLDRITMEPVLDARVDATAMEGGPVHSALADSSGIFTFPYLPAGEYEVVAYEDLNRNRQFDPATEPNDALSMSVAPGDTIVMTDFLRVLAPDTTAAVLQQAVALDSVTVRLTLDDYMEAEVDLSGVEADLTASEGDAPTVTDLLLPFEWEAIQAADADADPDTDPDADADSDGAGGVGQDADPGDGPDTAPDGGVAGDEIEPSADGVGDDTGDELELADLSDLGFFDDEVLPGREIILRLSGPLTEGVVYTVELTGVTNIRGLPGGGGTADFEWTPPEPEPEPESDGDGDDAPEPDPAVTPDDDDAAPAAGDP